MRVLFGLRGRALWLPLDDALISGPRNALMNTQALVREVEAIAGSGILAFPGTFMRFVQPGSPVRRIINLTASTTTSRHTRKVRVSTIETAVALAADGVAIHINVSSAYESEMLAMAAGCIDDAHRLGLPAIVISYPRTEGAAGDENYYSLRDNDHMAYADLVAHAARVALELGADVVKCQYTGSVESFQRVVDACAPVPLVVAGGPHVPPPESLELARGALEGGAMGVSFGRNVFADADPAAVLRTLAELVTSAGEESY